MTEILTESFCERCGTRYTFEAAAPKRPRLRGLKVIGRGLKNFVMSDDASLDEALAAARSEAEYEVTTHQLDAFHRTFNFCMSCRQYTCENCWDPVEARCLTCAPDGEKARAVAAAEANAAAVAEAEAARARSLVEAWPVAEFTHGDAANGGDDVGAALGPLDALLAAAPPATGTLPDAAAEAPHPAEPPEVAPAAAEAPEAPFAAGAPEGASAPEAPAAPPAAAEAPEARPAAEAPEAASAPGSDETVGALDAATVAPDARVDEQAVLGDLAAEAPTPPAARVEAGAEAPESVEVAAETESEPAPQVAEPAPQVAEPAPLEVHPEPEPEPATPIAAAEEVASEPSAPPPAAETPRTRSIRRYRPGQSLDDEIAAYEAALGRATDEAATAPGAGATERREPVPPQVAPEPAPAQGPDYEAVAATEAADLAAEATPADAVPSAPAPFTTELEPAAEPEPAREREPIAEPIAAAAAEPEPFAGPISPVRADPGPPAPAPTFAPPGPRSSEPVAWPSHPRWPSAPAVRDASTGAPVSDPLAAALARRATDAMWAQSANELLRAQPIPTPATLAAAAAAANAVQSCQGCGLSLSATARFCRRCGTRQGG